MRNRVASALFPVACLGLSVMACGGAQISQALPNADGGVVADSGAAGEDAGSLACTAIAAPVKAAIPHVSVAGDKGKGVIAALDAVLAAQSPQIAPGAKSYGLASLSCRDLEVPLPGATNGFACDFDIAIDGAAAVKVSTSAPSDLAEKLFDALTAAGAEKCADVAHGDFLRIQNVTIDIPSGATELDNGSSYALPPSPDVRASGDAGLAVLTAMQNAAIDDCSATQKAFVVCTKFQSAPTCGYARLSLKAVGGSALIYTCNPSNVTPGPTLNAAQSLALWNAILGAAAAVDFKPLNGTIAQATVVNASYFTWDGSTVGFQLTVDDVQGPPGPANGG